MENRRNLLKDFALLGTAFVMLYALGCHGGQRPFVTIDIPVGLGSGPSVAVRQNSTLHFIASEPLPAGHNLYVIFTKGSPCSEKIFVVHDTGPYTSTCKVIAPPGSPGPYPFVTGYELPRPQTCNTCQVSVIP